MIRQAHEIKNKLNLKIEKPRAGGLCLISLPKPAGAFFIRGVL